MPRPAVTRGEWKRSRGGMRVNPFWDSKRKRGKRRQGKVHLVGDKEENMLKRLFDMGLLERPYRGCYRLTEESRKIMKEVGD